MSPEEQALGEVLASIQARRGTATDRNRAHWDQLSAGSHPHPDTHPIGDYLNREGFNPVGTLLELPFNFAPGAGEGWFQGNQPAWGQDGMDYYPSAAENWAEGGLAPRAEAIMQWIARGGDAATAAGLGTILASGGLLAKPGGAVAVGGQGVKGVAKVGQKAIRNFRRRQANRQVRLESQRNLEDQALGDVFSPERVRRAEAAEKAEYDEGQRITSGQRVDEEITPADRAMVQPDKWRQAEKRRSQRSIIQELQENPHLREFPGGEGGYIGAPRDVQNLDDIDTMRLNLDRQFDEGLNVLNIADPDRVGTWYLRQKAAHDISHEPHQLPRGTEVSAAYSAGVSPESELAFALKHWNNRNLVGAEDPQVAYRGAPARMLDRAVEENVPAPLAFKVGEYQNKSNPLVPLRSLYGVNDFRWAQAMGYTDPQGNPWTAGVSSTMHPFMDAETALATARANERRAGGRANWQGPHLQEIPWVLGKAQAFYGRGSRTSSGQYHTEVPGDTTGMRQALRDANNTVGDYLHKHAATVTAERTPGAGLGHREDILSAPFEERQAYGDAAPWTLGDQNKDVFYSGMNMRQLPATEGYGVWEGPAGRDNNPLYMPRPLLDFPTVGKAPSGEIVPAQDWKWKDTMTGDVNDHTRRTVEAVEQLRAVLDAQHAGAANIPNTGNFPNQNALLVDTRPVGDPEVPFTGRQMGPEQERILSDRLGHAQVADMPEGTIPPMPGMTYKEPVMAPDLFGTTATNRGVLMFPYDQNSPTALRGKLEKGLGSLLELPPDAHGPVLFPGASVESARANTFYVPGLSKFDDAGNMVPTTPGSGEATMGALEGLARMPERAAQNLSTDEGVRQAIRGLMRRDHGHPLTREDVQRTRQFFAEADWGRAVRMVRRGSPPAAALAALGYSAAGMAAEEQEALMDVLRADSEGLGD